MYAVKYEFNERVILALTTKKLKAKVLYNFELKLTRQVLGKL